MHTFKRNYPTGPETVNSRGVESFLPSSVQMAPWGSRSPATGKTTVTSTPESERTLIHQLMMLGLSLPCAFLTVPERMTLSVL